MKKILALFFLGLIITACETTPNVSFWQHYQWCGNQYTDIRQIAQCGKQSRNSFLNQHGRYGNTSDGDMYVVFMDSLAEQVVEGKKTNSEAKLIWVQTTQNILNGYRQAAAQAATAGALQRQNNNKQIQQGMDMVTGACTLGVNC
jgi:hypothetical protein